MKGIRPITTSLLFTSATVASPGWWNYQGPGDPAKLAPDFTQALFSTTAASSQHGRYTPPPGGVVSSGILYCTTTIYLSSGESPQTPSASCSALAASTSPPASSSASLQSQSQSPEIIVPAASIESSELTSTLTITTARRLTVPFQTPAAASTASTAPAISSSQSVTTSLTLAAQPAVPSATTSGSITADMLIAIDSSTSTCSGAQFPEQCATAAQAATAFNAVFGTYKITGKAAQAAVIAWEVFESVGFKFTVNQQGNVGQGTRDMMSPQFVSEYATAVFGVSSVQTASTPTAVLALVNANDTVSFGGGAWFLSTKCPSVQEQFATDPDAAWTAMMGSGCVDTTDTSARDAYWTAAKKALGVA